MADEHTWISNIKGWRVCLNCSYRRRTSDRKFPPCSPRTYEVTVWDHEGDIVQKCWAATAADVEAVREKWADDPLKTVVVEER